MIRVRVANPYDFPLNHSQLKQAAQTVLQGEEIETAAVTVACVTDEHIHRLNRQFLQHDEPTDVLTFPYTAPSAARLEGEIVIGYQTAQREAEERGHSIEAELTLYVIHGCLHLCGYDDTTPAAANTMRQRERHYLKQLGWPDITSTSSPPLP
jgi:probable rRNA maturation factor